MHRSISVLAAAAVACTLAARPAGAGTIDPGLEAVMRATSAAKRIPVVIKLQAQADVGTAAATARTRAECVRAVEQLLKGTATATQNAPTAGRARGLLDELSLAGSFQARDIRSFWITNAVSLAATSQT